MSAERDHALDVFGTQARLLVIPGAPGAGRRIRMLDWRLREMHRVLTRFEPGSELSRLNSDPRSVVPVSDVLAEAVGAALRAAHLSGGLVDPTLLSAVVGAGYDSSFAHRTPAALARALDAAPARRTACPATAARWRRVRVSNGHVTRPPGVQLDLGGSAKGHAADVCAALLAREQAYAVDLGGDLRIGGTACLARTVEVEHPITRATAHRFTIAAGAVATSGVARRLWQRGNGRFGHHLIDPATGGPAWTGVLQATALAPTALEAEALAKVALLSGPERGLEALAPGGGLLVLDDGSVRVAAAKTRAAA